MTFQQLMYVVEISKCGSINKAANKLFLSQSGISTAIRELEEELGIQFFVRSNRGVEFTADGFTAVDTPVATNFNLANGDTAAGGESSQARYNALMGFFLDSQAATAKRVKTAMSHVAQDDADGATQWTMVYDQSAPFVTWYFQGDFSNGVTLPILPDSHSR